ncbi:transcriptional regulator [Vallicoccus soli]|uniref:Transcriptional regulator n=2 Tax=Vallicoccus soli TaxID=2339232 RepID=A0A3A3ZN80_9ACTN|nr:transcriptional regulator [Vallicoccus soli]
MPRMAARVFAYVLAEDAERYTAADLAEGLRISPAAVSGAVRYLVHARMLFREREPGRRGDVYRVYDDDVWRAIMLAQLPVMEHWEAVVGEAVALVGADRPGGARLAETQEFFRFLREEMAGVVARWGEHRGRLRAPGTMGPPGGLA